MGKDVVEVPAHDLSVGREAKVVIAEAEKAAKALKEIIERKTKKVTFNGEQYLEFEDWQTVGKFYGLTVKVVSSEFVEFGNVKGFTARAVVIHLPTGQEVSAAEAMCLNDEPKWSERNKYEWRGPYGNRERVLVSTEPVPLFQLKSMAQTRACAKALRNVCSWVVVLAGYKTTPAEEMTGSEDDGNDNGGDDKPAGRGKGEQPISEAQQKRFWFIARHKSERTNDEIKDYLKNVVGVARSEDIPRSKYEAACTWLEEKPRAAGSGPTA